MLANYHTHSAFCDGEMMPEDYVLAAVRKGFSAIGFTSHAPVPFCTDWTMKPENLDKYIENINDLKKKYKNQIQIYTGLETDFYPGSADFRNHPGVDFTIGSVHFIHDQKTAGILVWTARLMNTESLYRMYSTGMWKLLWRPITISLAK